MHISQLTKDSKEKLIDYVEENIIPKELIVKILRSESAEELVKAITTLYNINDQTKKDIWYHIITKETDIDVYHIIFLRKLLNNKGFVRKVDIYKSKILNTDFKIRRAAKKLFQKGLIQIYSLSNQDIVYTLDIKYYLEATNEN